MIRITREVFNFYERLKYQCGLAYTNLTAINGADILNEVLNWTGVGYRKCHDCRLMVDDWLQCIECDRKYCRSCGTFTLCPFCNKDYCGSCANFTFLDCHNGPICDDCLDENGENIFQCDACEDWICCGRDIYSFEDGCYCENCIPSPELIHDGEEEPLHQRNREHAADVSRAYARIVQLHISNGDVSSPRRNAVIRDILRRNT